MNEYSGQRDFAAQLSDTAGKHATLASRLHRMSLDRADHFQTDLVRNPEWEVLLSLFVASAEGLRMPFASLCAANRMSRTVAERSVEALSSAGLVRWERNAEGQGAEVSMTAHGRIKVNQFLQRVATSA